MIVLEAEFNNGAFVRKQFLDEHDAKLWAYLNGDHISDYTYWKSPREVPE